MNRTFKAYCQQGHDRIDFIDGDAFEEHMHREHNRRTIYVGQGYGKDIHDGRRGSWVNDPNANGWTRTGFKVYPWKAPRAPKDTEKLARVLAAHSSDTETYGVADVGTVDVVTDGLWRYDRENADDVPVEALPARYQGILTGAIARHEMWLLHVQDNGASIRVEVARKEGRKVTAAGRLDIRDGKVRNVQAVEPNAEWRHWEDSRITRVRELFPASESIESVASPEAA